MTPLHLPATLRIKMPSAMREQLDAAAQRRGQAVAVVVRELLRQFLLAEDAAAHGSR